MVKPFILRSLLWLGILTACHTTGVLRAAGPEVLRVATYNLENYLLDSRGGRPVKSAVSRARVCACLLALKADVIALQEVGGIPALRDLQQSLRAAGMDYPYRELVQGYDTNIQVAVLSRFPIVERQAHTREGFLLRRRWFHLTRGFAEVSFQVRPDYPFTLITTHLKSRRPIPQADQAEIREEEARLLRQLIDTRLQSDPGMNLVVMGDFNDLANSPAVRTIIGRGRTGLFDTRPAERNGDVAPSANPRYPPRRITWTHYYGKEETYSRVDYLLISQGMQPEWLADETYVLAVPDWGLASDHRPLVAGFRVGDR